MTFETRYTWEKLTLEMKLLRQEDFGALVQLCIGIQSVLWPSENVETCFRATQFLGFEMQKACEGKEESERWEILRHFIFEEKGFQISSARPSEASTTQLLMKEVLEDRTAHPLILVFLILHLAHYLELPLALIQARHHFLLKWVRSGKTIYLDLYNEGRPLTESQLVKVLNRSASNLEIWSAPQLMNQYLEQLLAIFERQQNLNQLHIVYNLILQIDDTNTDILGQRALLRQRMGFQREALCDLKRYFSFVERTRAPGELQQAWMELENTPEPPARGPTDRLH